MQERVSFASELATTSSYFFEDPTSYDEQGVKKRWKDDSATLLAAYANRLEASDAFTAETVEAELRALAEEHEAGAGRIIHPTRLAVSGVTFGPSLFHMMEVLGQDTCVQRIRKAVEVLG
jgi:glutamyl-tRNA synthetase